MVVELIHQVRARGLPVILISHNMPQVFELADRIHIQRLGRRIAVVKACRLQHVRCGGDYDWGPGRQVSASKEQLKQKIQPQ